LRNVRIPENTRVTLRLGSTNGECEAVAPTVPREESGYYWGYTVQRDGGTSEYEVRHPPWRVATATRAELRCDVGRIYGDAFVEPLKGPPDSAFLAEGSPVIVCRGVRNVA